jgi:hypothetical protein
MSESLSLLKEKAKTLTELMRIYGIIPNNTRTFVLWDDLEPEIEKLQKANDNLAEAFETTNRLYEKYRGQVEAAKTKIDAILNAWKTAYSLEAHHLQGEVIDDLEQILEVLGGTK